MSTEQRLATAKSRIKRQRDALLAKGIDPDAPRTSGDSVSVTKYKASRINLSAEQISEYEESLGTVSYEELLAHVVEVRTRPGETSRHVPAVNPYTEAHKQALRDEYSVKIAQAMLFVLWRFNQEGALSRACDHECLSYGAIKAWRKTFPLFNEILAEMEEELIQAADDELYDRAVRGIDKPVISQGAVVFVKAKSDDLLKFYLQNNRKKYEAKQVTEITGANGGPVKSVGLDLSSLRGLSDAELEALQQLMEKANAS